MEHPILILSRSRLDLGFGKIKQNRFKVSKARCFYRIQTKSYGCVSSSGRMCISKSKSHPAYISKIILFEIDVMKNSHATKKLSRLAHTPFCFHSKRYGISGRFSMHQFYLSVLAIMSFIYRISKTAFKALFKYVVERQCYVSFLEQYSSNQIHCK